MPQGRVKRYERNAGYGFIETPEGELFVHHTALKEREFLLPGQQVEFQVEPGDRGPRAVDVRVTEEVAPKRKNHPDWRGRRGSAPRFDSEERVLPGGTGKSRRTSRAPASDRLGPPRDEGDDRIDAEEKESVDTAAEE